MLVLSRRKGQSVDVSFAGQTLRITVLDLGRGTVRIGFTGPRDVVVERTELQTTRDPRIDAGPRD